MNIREVKNLVEGASYEQKVEILENITERVGDCLEIGFLGSSVSNISYEENGFVEFESEKITSNSITRSTGAVLDESVVIMQIQEGENTRLIQLYSWRIDGSKYTYLTFDSVLALTKAYDQIKKLNKCFLAENIDDDLADIGVSYRDIMDIKVAIGVPKKNINEKSMISDFEDLFASVTL